MEKIPLKNILLVFLKIGSFSFGGVYSMLAFFEREIVEKRQWLTHDEFVEAVAIGQITPGPPIVNSGIFIGYKLNSIRGALTATLGQTFPGVAMAILLAMFYVNAQESALLKCVMKGVGAAVVGLLAAIIFKMGKKVIVDYKSAIFAALAFLALAVFKFNAISIIIVACLLGTFVFEKRKQS